MTRKTSLTVALVGILAVIGAYLYTQSNEPQVEIEIVAGTMAPPEDMPRVALPPQPSPSHSLDTAESNDVEQGEVVYVDHPDNVRAAKEAEAAGIAAKAASDAADAQLNAMLTSLDRMQDKANAVLAYSEAFLNEHGLANSLTEQYLREKYGGRPLTETEMETELNNPEYMRLAKQDMDRYLADLE